MQDLNIIRTRAGIPNSSALNKQALIDLIFIERRRELFTEYGHRWLDLKRTGAVDNVMALATTLKGGTWDATDKLYQFLVLKLWLIQGCLKIQVTIKQ